jgi:hypothetical protein
LPAINLTQDLLNITKRTPLLLALLAIAICVRSFVFYLGTADILVDFDVFYLGGELFRQGRLAEAHHFSRFVRLLLEATGISTFMLWSYPPQFALILTLFSLLPKPLAYLAFVGLSFGAYLLLVKRIAGACFGVALLASYGTLLVNVSCGQNGALSAALLAIVCSACVLTPERYILAGTALGLLVIKPHLALGVVALLVFSRRWLILAVAGVVAASSSLLMSAILGFSYWVDLLSSFREAKYFLSQGAYPFYRMVSVYALLRSLGFSAEYAFAMQGLVGVLALAGLFVVVKRGCSSRVCFASAVLATLFISPYLYNYDLAAIGVLLALILPEVVKINQVRGRAVIDLGGRSGRYLALLVTFSFLAAYSGVLWQYFGELLGYNLTLSSEAQQRSAENLEMIVASDLELLNVEGGAGAIPSFGAVFLLGVVYILQRLVRARGPASANITPSRTQREISDSSERHPLSAAQNKSAP